MTHSIGRATALMLCLMLASVGCSFSTSSEIISKIVSSPLESSSASGSPEETYEEDVRDFTTAHVQSGGTADGLIREIGKLAEKHGITDWERSEATYRAVGAGLAEAGWRQVQVDAFKNNFAQTTEQRAWLQKGYDAAR